MSRAAEKLRAQGSLCQTIQVGLQPLLAEREGLCFCEAVTLALPTPTNDTREILALAIASRRPRSYSCTFVSLGRC
uniref:DinB/UmuC family translesion DNA polymerase n=1 Tax=Pseudomonas tohonis TaxID=2725477 RepID=UPI0035A25C8A